MDPSSAQNQVFQRPEEQERRGVMMMKPQQLNCPRCDSTNTKFCYYNNYSLLQPRYFCKACKRYWTQGGTLRNVPKGGGGGGGFKKSNKRRSSSPSIRGGDHHHQQQQQIVMNTTNSSSSQVFSSLLPPLAFGNNFMGQFGLDGFHEYGDATTTTATVITTSREELVCKQGGDEENRGWDFQWNFGGEGECMSGVGLDRLSWQELVYSPAQ